MTDRGFVAIDRGIWDHPIFAPEPYTEREAWQWMIHNAVWKPTRVRVGRAAIELERGQLAYATRFLATKWQWSESRVRRYLHRLENDAMVTLETTHESTRITICNYNKWQPERRDADAPSDAQTDAPPTRSRRKEEQDNKLTSYDDVDEERPRPGAISSDAWDVAESIAKTAGFPEPTDWPPGWCGFPARIQTFLNEGYPAAVIVAACEGVLAKKRDGPPTSYVYFDKPIAAEFARQQKPIPMVEISQQETVNVRIEADKSAGSAANRILSRLQGFDAPGGGGRQGTPDVRLLSKG